MSASMVANCQRMSASMSSVCSDKKWVRLYSRAPAAAAATSQRSHLLQAGAQVHAIVRAATPAQPQHPPPHLSAHPWLGRQASHPPPPPAASGRSAAPPQSCRCRGRPARRGPGPQRPPAAHRQRETCSCISAAKCGDGASHSHSITAGTEVGQKGSRSGAMVPALCQPLTAPPPHPTPPPPRTSGRLRW